MNGIVGLNRATLPQPEPPEAQPCPFCWQVAWSVLALAPGMQVVTCTVCHAQGPVGATAEEAVLNWTLQDGCVQARCPVCMRGFRRPYNVRKMYCSVRCRVQVANARAQQRRQQKKIDALADAVIFS